MYQVGSERFSFSVFFPSSVENINIIFVIVVIKELLQGRVADQRHSVCENKII